MSERSIIFSAPKVRAILDGRKTVTRRVVKPQPTLPTTQWWPSGAAGPMWMADGPSESTGGTRQTWGWNRCPYGQVGDRLWVREAHALFPTHGQHRADGTRWGPWAGLPTVVSPDGSQIAYFREGFDRCDPGRWRPSIHMPRWASRITLEVTAVRVERLQDISEEQARAEGVQWWPPIAGDWRHPDASKLDALPGFQKLWESINGAGSWADNPWVWVVEFKRIEKEVPHGG